MKLKVFFLIALILFNVVIITLFIKSYQERQERLEAHASYTLTHKEQPTSASTDASKNAEDSGVQKETQKEQEKKYTFRKTVWGMSNSDVRLSEELDPIEEQENILMYNDTNSGMNTSIGYLFTEDKLFRAVNMFNCFR